MIVAAEAEALAALSVSLSLSLHSPVYDVTADVDTARFDDSYST